MSLYLKQLFIIGLSLVLVSCNNNEAKKNNPTILESSADSMGKYDLPENFILTLPRATTGDLAFDNFADSINLEEKYIPCCACDRAETYLYFDSTARLVAERTQYITSSQSIDFQESIHSLIYTPKNFKPSFFFTEATGKNYYYDSTKQKLIELPYSELNCRDNGEEFIRVGLGLQPNIKYAFLNAKTLEPICDFVYEKIDDFVDGFATVTKNGLIGMLNRKGEEIISCDYETIYPHFDNGFIVVERDGKYGLFDTAGKELISCEHGGIVYFEDGFALIQKEDKYGLFDTKKAKTTTCNYEGADFYSGILVIAQEGSFYDGFEIVSKDFFFEDGLVLVTKNGKRGMLNDKGKEVISCLYEHIDLFVEKGFAIVEKGGKYGMFNTEGKEILPCNYNDITPYFEDGFVVTERHSEPAECQMISTKGEVISRKYETIYYFEGEFAIAEIDDKELIINKKGKEVSSEYESIDYFYNSRFGIAINEDKQVIINVKGEEVSQEYERIVCCTNGFAVVKSKKNGKYGIINQEGKEVVACKYEYEKIYQQLPLQEVDDVKSSISKE